jgi:uncharacterized protein with HEPN domain
MRKIELQVPENITFLSDWDDLDKKLGLDENRHIILNKRLTGCGATSYFLNNPNLKVILASPRKLLLENKFVQSKEDFIHLFRLGDSNDEDLQQDIEMGEETKDKKKDSQEDLKVYKDKLFSYLQDCTIKSLNPKILVTYDSIKYVLGVVKEYGENLKDYIVVVDEFHSIFQDSRFKAEVELNFLSCLKSIPNVVYLSATPILENYLDEMESFKNLPYYELVWPKNKIATANIIRVETKSLLSEAVNVVNSYKLGNFPSKEVDGEIIESREAVLFLNSVSDIVRLIKKTKLKEDEVNIICSVNSYNTARLKKIRHKIGKVPKKGKDHKMFTLCTRTSFLGADFYSTCASTYIFADPNVESLSIDISMDLPQIIGRQRLPENCFRYDIMMFYKTTTALRDHNEFLNYLEDKKIQTNAFLDIAKMAESSKPGYKSLVDKSISSVKLDKYSKDYVGLTDKGELVFNNLVLLSERRSWEVQQINFKGNVEFLNTLTEEGYKVVNGDFQNNASKFFIDFNNTNSVEKRLRLIYDFAKTYGEETIFTCSFIPSKYLEYVKRIGLEKIKTLEYREKDIENYLLLIGEAGKIFKNWIKEHFEVGKKYLLSSVRDDIANKYKELGINKISKATDLENYILAKKVKIDRDAYLILSHELSNVINNEVSYCKNIFNPADIKPISVDEVLDIIRTGKDGIKEQVEKYRNNTDIFIEKARLPLICWNGVFSYKNNSSLVKYSSYIALDYDKVNNIEELKEKLIKIPYVKAIFKTPSGNGLKVIVQHGNSDYTDHDELFKQLELLMKFDGFDSSVSDISRGNFLSYDPDIYINPNPEIFMPTPIVRTYKKPRKSTNLEPYKYKSSECPVEDNRIIGCLDSYWKNNYPESYKEGNRHNSVLKQAAKLCRAGIEYSRTISYLISRFDLPEIEIIEIVKYIYNKDISDFGKDRDSFKK